MSKKQTKGFILLPSLFDIVVRGEGQRFYSFHRWSFAYHGGKSMAKQTKKTVTYKGQKYTVLDRTEDKVMLTDGLIHFWVKAKDVEA